MLHGFLNSNYTLFCDFMDPSGHTVKISFPWVSGCGAPWKPRKISVEFPWKPLESILSHGITSGSSVSRGKDYFSHGYRGNLLQHSTFFYTVQCSIIMLFSTV